MFAWSCSSDSFWLVLFGTSLWLLWAFVFAWLAGSFGCKWFGFRTGLGAGGGLWLIDLKLDFVSAGLLELYERFGFFVRRQRVQVNDVWVNLFLVSLRVRLAWT